MRECVITGLGPVTPIGIGKEKFWGSLLRGESKYSEIKRFKLEEYDKTRIAAQIDGFEPSKYVDSRILESIKKLNAENGGLSIFYAVAGAKLAVEDAKLDLSANSRKIGVAIGTSAGDPGLLQKSETDFAHSGYSLSNAHAGIVARTLGINGINVSVSGACATGNLALRSGCLEIMCGRYDVMVVGSSEAAINISHYFGDETHRRRGLLGISKRNDIERGMLPFDQDRDGLVLAEGAGILIVEEMNHAVKRGAHIYAKVAGFGEFTEFTGNTIHVSENGYVGAIDSALKDAQVTEKDFRNAYVNAHGSATPLNDGAESAAIYRLMGTASPVSSFKGTTGHSFAATSSIELIGCAMVLDTGLIPKSNLRKVAQDCAALDYIMEGREERVDVVIKNAAGFNGIYSTIVLRKV